MSSGGPGSLVAWDTLGFQGRTFAGGATSTDELSAFAGPGGTPMAPIRAYAGLQSAEDADARAALVVQELDRTGAWDRSVLVVATATGTGTGTGWINPVAAESLEYLYDGDSADAIAAGADGMLFVGPTATNPVWTQLTDARDAGSPAWQPQFADGTQIAFAAGAGAIDAKSSSWAQPRTLYLHHPNDPVGAWDWADLYRTPNWMQQPIGPGLPPDARWVPVITWVQEVADLAAGFSTPPGYGHDYTDAFAQSWAAVAPPDGWTGADTDRLAEYLAST